MNAVGFAIDRWPPARSWGRLLVMLACSGLSATVLAGPRDIRLSVPRQEAKVRETAAGEETPGRRYALLVFGASGGDLYAAKHAGWRGEVVEALAGGLRFERDRILVLSEDETDPARRSTVEAVERAFAGLRARLKPRDLLLVILFGHGTDDGTSAKFNLVGPDLDASGWKRLLDTLPSRLVVVNTTSASFPFLEALAAPNRAVVTATDSAAQRYETVFPRFLIDALARADDLDKDRRTSLWDVFAAASASVQRHFEQRGQLPTERAMLDDTGEGTGIAAGAGAGPRRAARLFLDPDPREAAFADAAKRDLIRRQQDLLGRIADLQAQRASVPPDRYEAELEALLVELAKVSRLLRAKS